MNIEKYCEHKNIHFIPKSQFGTGDPWVNICVNGDPCSCDGGGGVTPSCVFDPVPALSDLHTLYVEFTVNVVWLNDYAYYPTNYYVGNWEVSLSKHFSIDWGDGTIDAFPGAIGATVAIHFYSGPGIYTIRISLGTVYENDWLITKFNFDKLLISIDPDLMILTKSPAPGGINPDPAKHMWHNPVVINYYPTQPYYFTNMLKGCTGLTSIPRYLLAWNTDLTLTGASATQAHHLYAGMFEGCTGLTSLPYDLLRATRILPYTYYRTFYGCTGLLEIPSCFLYNVEEAVEGCFSSMFEGCTGLTTIEPNALPLSVLGDNETAYLNMFKGCTSLTDIGNIDLLWFADRPISTANHMFEGCTNINTPITYAQIPALWK